MKPYKKVILIFGLITSIVSCGSSNEGKNSEKELVIWHCLTSKNSNFLREAIESFKINHPEYKVKTVFKSSDQVLLDSCIDKKSSKESPDMVFTTDLYLSEYIKNDLLFDISTFFNDSEIGLSDKEKSDLNQSLMKQCYDESNNSIYYLPFVSELTTLTYNKNDFDRYFHIVNSEYDNSWEGVFDTLMPVLKEEYMGSKITKVYYEHNRTLFKSWLNDYAFTIDEIFNNLETSLPNGLLKAIDTFASAYANDYFETYETFQRLPVGKEFFFTVFSQTQIGYNADTEITGLPITRGVMNSQNNPAKSNFALFMNNESLSSDTILSKMKGS